MLAAGHQAQTEPGLIERDVGHDQRDERDDHEPVALKGTDLEREGFSRLDVLDGRGHVVGVGGRVERLDDDGRRGDAEHIHRRADDGLIRLEVDARHSQQRGKEHAERDAAQQREQDGHECGRAARQVAHDERAAECADDHDALKTEVDDAGVFREAAAQRDEHQNGGEDEGVLQQQGHCASPPFSESADACGDAASRSGAEAASVSGPVCADPAASRCRSSRRAALLFMAVFRKSTKPHI